MTPITGTSSDINILSDSPTYARGSTGVYHRSPSILNISRIGARGLSAGINYMDYPYRNDGYTPTSEAPEAGFPVYPWVRGGSLGNQGTTTANE